MGRHDARDVRTKEVVYTVSIGEEIRVVVDISSRNGSGRLDFSEEDRMVIWT